MEAPAHAEGEMRWKGTWRNKPKTKRQVGTVTEVLQVVGQHVPSTGVAQRAEGKARVSQAASQEGGRRAGTRGREDEVEARETQGRGTRKWYDD